MIPEQQRTYVFICLRFDGCMVFRLIKKIKAGSELDVKNYRGFKV
jgi:hypothetical protein